MLARNEFFYEMNWMEEKRGKIKMERKTK